MYCDLAHTSHTTQDAHVKRAVVDMGVACRYECGCGHECGMDTDISMDVGTGMPRIWMCGRAQMWWCN